MSEINSIVKEHIMKQAMDLTTLKNYNRREFIQRFNEILYHIGLTLSDKREITKEAITQFISSKYFLSEVAVRRYINIIFNSGIFVYDEKTKTLSLPDDVFKKVLEEKQQQKSSSQVSENGGFGN